MTLVNLNKKLNSASRRRDYKPKNLTKSLARIFGILLIILIALGIPGWMVVQGAKQTSRNGKNLVAAFKSQNFDEIKKYTTETRKSLESTKNSLNFLFWLGVIPFVGGYYNDVKGFTGAGVEELKATEILLNEWEPYKVELGFNSQPQASNDRVTQAIKILDKSLPHLVRIEQNLKNASESVEDIDTNKYPVEFNGFKVRAMLETVKNGIIGAYLMVSQNRDALDRAPGALGLDSPKNYLILFQNDKEIRATGGFITAFAFLKLDRGQIITTTSDDIYRLDERLLATCLSKVCPLSPPAPIVKYLPEVSGKPRSAWSMRDSNISPDLPTSAREFERMYQLLGQGLPFDGVIYIDSQVVEELIEVTGPVDVFGNTFSAQKDDRCSCPKVIYELESYAEIAAKGEQDRKAILGVLMSQILAKVVGADVEKVPQFIDTIARLANHKHIMFYMHDGATQKAISKLNWTGEIKDFDGDYLHINDSNFAGGKSNLYVDQTVTQEIKIEKGKVVKKLAIEYKNPQPFNIWLNGINRDYVRFYTPKGSKLVSSKGSDDPVNTFEELDKTVFDAFITVRPQNSRKLEIEYEVLYDLKGEYKLMIQKQPGAKDHRYIIKLNNKQVQDSKLDMDKKFKFDL